MFLYRYFLAVLHITSNILQLKRNKKYYTIKHHEFSDKNHGLSVMKFHSLSLSFSFPLNGKSFEYHDLLNIMVSWTWPHSLCRNYYRPQVLWSTLGMYVDWLPTQNPIWDLDWLNLVTQNYSWKIKQTKQTSKNPSNYWFCMTLVVLI